MKNIYTMEFNAFVIPFVLGMTFVLCWCVIGAARIIMELDAKERKTFFLSLLNPKIMAKNIKEWFCDCLFHVKLWKRNKLLGYMHSSIAFGWFMLIVIGHIEVFLYTPERIHRLWYPIFFRYFVKLINNKDVPTDVRRKYHAYLTHLATVMAEQGVNLSTMLYGGRWRQAPAKDESVCLTPHLTGCMLMEAMSILEPLE